MPCIRPIRRKRSRKADMKYEIVFYEHRRFTKVVEASSPEEAADLADKVEGVEELIEDNEFYDLEYTCCRKVEG
jgi:hypothetical protein